MRIFLIMFLSLTSTFASELVVHEWGTFTSMMGSNGQLVDGLHHEEDPLPYFIHGLSTNCGQNWDDKCLPENFKQWLNPINIPAHGVTQKMETPVIYFYSPEEMEVSVKVDFPDGLISQWFPNPESFEPSDLTNPSLKNGKLNWKVKLSTEKLNVLNTQPDSIWNPAREVASNYLSSQGENEKFIFYRGVSNFQMPWHLRSPHSGYFGFGARNGSGQKIPFIMAINYLPGSGVEEPAGIFHPFEENSGTFDENLNWMFLSGYALPVSKYLEEVSELLQKELIKSGLFEDEALAMVNTWKKSYFLTPGPRIIYIMPREWVDKILPLEINPVPKNLVRTFVGRIELRTSNMDQDLLDMIRTNNVTDLLHDPLGEAKLRSLYHQLQNEADQTLVKNLISRINGL